MPDDSDLELQEHEKEQEALRAMGLSDDEVALRFADAHAGSLRYVAFWKKWLRFDGIRWKIDKTRNAYDLVRDLCRDIARSRKGAARKLLEAKRVNAIHHMAQSDRRLAAEPDIWDLNPYLLNGANGLAADLQTGTYRPASADDLCTKVAGAACDAWMETPIWDAYLRRVTGGDVELQKYLQRVAGYCCSGLTSEHVLFFLYGTGANGKSVYINTLSGVLGDYAAIASMDEFMKSRHSQHPTGLAHLQGARLVIASETDGGEAWSEAKIKRLTSDDKVSARYMRGDFFDFKPQFKIMIAGNHVPTLDHVDEAFRRRLHLIPFTVTIPEEERDASLPDQLKAEWPGILAWAIAGAFDWMADGLQPPEAVVKATRDYFENQNLFAQWFEEYCIPADSYAFETTAELYASYKRFMLAAGEIPPNSKRFSMTMVQEAGCKRDRSTEISRDRGFRGIRLKRPNVSEDPRFPT